jgi:predicted nuclease of predicted toxin-antitoxin system
MRLLLDESLPRGLKKLLDAHEVATVQEKGWAGTSNGALLRLAELKFDVFVTADQNLQYQQNLVGFDISVILLAAPSTRISDLEPLIPKVLAELPELIPGEVRRIAL